MKTEFIKKHNEEIKEIKSINDWKLYASPKGQDKQWVIGRSAYSMADFAINHNENFNKVITDILNECKIEIQDFKCEPEATAGLGKGMKKGGSRNHDLLMVGTKNCVIGIEAKVSESFDNNWRDVQKEQGDNDDTRAFALKKFLTPNKDCINDIGYQLFTATRGTMMSAMKERYENAILLVIVFVGEDIKRNSGENEKKYDENIKKNDNDFAQFLCAVDAHGNGMIQRKIGRETINCWIKKVKIEISHDYTIAK